MCPSQHTLFIVVITECALHLLCHRKAFQKSFLKVLPVDMSSLLACMTMLHVCDLCSRKLERDMGVPETGVIGICGSPCGCWESKPGPLEVQDVLLSTDLSLQPIRSISDVTT